MVARSAHSPSCPESTSITYLAHRELTGALASLKPGGLCEFVAAGWLGPNLPGRFLRPLD